MTQSVTRKNIGLGDMITSLGTDHHILGRKESHFRIHLTSRGSRMGLVREGRAGLVREGRALVDGEMAIVDVVTAIAAVAAVAMEADHRSLVARASGIVMGSGDDWGGYCSLFFSVSLHIYIQALYAS